MKHTLLTTIALVLTPATAHAQLLGGVLGGGIGLPTGTVGSSAGVVVEQVGSGVNATGAVSAAGSQAVRAPRVRQPAIVNATGAVAFPATTIVHVAVPAVPDIAVRTRLLASHGVVAVPVAEVPAYVDSQVVVYENELRGTGAKVRKEGNQIVIDMPADVTFAFDKSDIQPRFRAALDSLSRTLNRYPSSYIDVYGHTDSIGSYAYNQALSERRADSVAGYLEARGVFGGRMHTEGFGKTEPKASNATIEGRAANRRVEMVITPYAA